MNFRPVPSEIYHHSMVLMSKLDRLVAQGEYLIPLKMEASGWRLCLERDSEIERWLPHVGIYDMLENGTAYIEYNYFKPEVQALRLIHGTKQIGDFPLGERQHAWFYEKLIKRLDGETLTSGKKLPRSGKHLEAYLKLWTDEIYPPKRSDQQKEGFSAPKIATFNRAYRDYHKHDRNVLALVKRHRGPGRKVSTCDADSINFATMEARAYIDRLKPTKSHIFLQYKAALFAENKVRSGENKPELHEFKRKKFEKIINGFDPFEVKAGREGEKLALEYFSPNLRSFDIVVPGQQVELDGWKSDLMTLFSNAGMQENIPFHLREVFSKIRIWFLVAIDVATRYVLAVKATVNPDAETALAAVRMIMSDKRHISDSVGANTAWVGRCRPFEMLMDNDTGFTADVFIQGLATLGIGVTRPPAGQPRKRPFIESLFHTVAPLFTTYFDGRTFASVAEKGEYKPELHASLIEDEAAKLITLMICDIYHNKPHSSLGGRTPHNAWVQASTREVGVRFGATSKEMLAAFGKVQKPHKLSRYGLMFYGITYRNPELDRQMLTHGLNQFVAKIDENRLNSILVKGIEGWFEVNNTIGLEEDVTLAEWVAARRESLAEAKAESAAGLPALYAAINRMRKTGEAATLRAGLTTRTLSASEIEDLKRGIFLNFEPDPDSARTFSISSEIVVGPDPLFDGNVAPLPRPRQAYTEKELKRLNAAAAAKSKKTEKPSKPSKTDTADAVNSTVAPKTSKFNQDEEY